MEREPEIDPLENQGDPNGQQPDGGQGNEPGNGEQVTSPTEYVEFEGVKVPASAFEKTARERYKDAFEAKENRDKWQAENTRKAQENAEKIRKAELYEQLLAQGRLRQETPQDPYEAKKKEYVSKKARLFPDVDPRFFESQFDDIQELAEMKGRELVNPIYERDSEKFERDFLAAHPKVQKGSEQYQQIARLIGAGIDAEKAYQTVFQDDIFSERLKAETEKAIKARDEEAKRKLQNSRQASVTKGSHSKGKNFEDRAWSIIERMK